MILYPRQITKQRETLHFIFFNTPFVELKINSSQEDERSELSSYCSGNVDSFPCWFGQFFGEKRRDSVASDDEEATSGGLYLFGTSLHCYLGVP